MPKISNAELDRLVWEAVKPLAGPVYLWDLDSTVCSTVHRRHMVDDIKAGRSTWDDYAMQCGADTPIAGSVALMRELKGSHVAVSGRSVLAEDITRRWLQHHAVPVYAVILRPAGDHTPNALWKIRVIKSLKHQRVDVRLFFEDWADAARQIAEETGIPVVGINPFDPEGEGVLEGAL